MAKELFENSDISIQNLLKQVEEGSLQLPNFQRDFVWPENKQKDLLTSIQKSFPTGSLLLMAVDSQPQLAFRPIKFFEIKNEQPKLLVLDGQQRVSSLAYIFSEKHNRDKRAFFNLRRLFSSKAKPGEVDLSDENIVEIRKFNPKEDCFASILKSKELLPCSAVINSNLKADLLGAFRDELRKKGKSENSFLHFLDRLEPYFEPFLNYRFPSIKIFAEADLEVVSTIFTKLNTQGQRLSAFDLCVAKYFKESGGKWQLKEFLEKEKESDPRLAIVDDDGTNFLQAIALNANVEHKKASLVKHLGFEQIQDHKPMVLESLKEMGKFFMEVFKCEDIRDIPYDATIPPLTLVFKNWTSKPVAKRSVIQKRIEKWLIVSSLKRRYTEGTDVTQKQDKEHTVPWVLSEASAPEPSSLKEPWILDEEFIKSSTGSRKTILVQILKKSSVSDFISGNTPSEVHHIFPKKYLTEKKIHPELVNSIFNLTLISKQTNASIGGKQPSKYISEDILPALRKANKENKTESEKRLKNTLTKHFIDEKAYKKLLENDYQGFLKARARAFGNSLKKDYGISFEETGDKKN